VEQPGSDRQVFAKLAEKPRQDVAAGFSLRQPGRQQNISPGGKLVYRK
jgi:hypothetical protein